MALTDNTPTPAPSQPSPYAVTAWGSTSEDFTTPSGQRCLLRKPDIAALMRDGLLEVINRLDAIVDGEVIPKAEGRAPSADMQTVMKLLSDPDKFDAVMQTVDRVVLHSVIQPKIHPNTTEEERVPGRVYVDSIDFRDKMAIFEKMFGGLRELETFRSATDEPS